jgi:hypothetical protein
VLGRLSILGIAGARLGAADLMASDPCPDRHVHRVPLGVEIGYVHADLVA